MTCRSGCKTQDHADYATCLRAARVTTPATMNSPLSAVYDKTKGDLDAYRSARSHGIQPGATTMQKVQEAQAATKLLGRPYDANTMPPAHMIVNKNTARFVNTED